MATGPIDYSINVQQPFQAALQGFQGGLAIRELQEAQAERERQRAAAEAMQRDLAAFAAKSERTGADYAALIARYPQLSEHYKRAYDIEGPERKANTVSQLTRTFAALHKGNVQVAEDLLTQQATAARNSGDQRTAAGAEAMRRLIRADPEAAKLSIAGALAGATGESFTDIMSKLGAEQRAEAKAPAELLEAEAKATKAGAEANKADIEAALHAKKLGAEIGLTEAQAAEAYQRVKKMGVEMRKLDAETQKLLLEAENGGLDPEKRFQFEQKLRDEYAKQTATFQDVRESYRRVRAANNDAAGDLALIFGFMKMLDPGSVVREGEFANAQNAAGVSDRVRNIYNRLLSGERLTEGQRKQFRAQAKSIMDASTAREKMVRKGLERVAGNYGLNTANVFLEPPGASREVPATVTSDADFERLPSGAYFLDPQGNLRQKP